MVLNITTCDWFNDYKLMKNEQVSVENLHCNIISLCKDICLGIMKRMALQRS